MIFPESHIAGKVDAETYPLGENTELPNGSTMALLALSHTTTEHRIYLAMQSAANGDGEKCECFTTRRLMSLTGIRSLSTIRRGLEGLAAKLSIEREQRPNGNGGTQREVRTAYRVYSPEEIVARRQERGLKSDASQIKMGQLNQSFDRAISRVFEKNSLSRREAQVALCCVEGLTNAEIGHRLQVSEQTVKFHLRHVFIKFGVKRRAELISRLLM